MKGFETYQKTSNAFCDFLRTVRTEQSANELASHLLIKETLLGKINVGRSKIEYLISEGSFKSLTQRSLSSGYSKSSSRSIGSILLRKEAKLEAQRTMLKHLDEELVLEAQLKRLKAQREMKMVESELSVLKEDPRLQELASSLSSESKTEEYLKLLPRYEQDRKQHENAIETSQSNSFSDCRQKEDAVVSTPKQSSTSPPIATAYVQEETPQLHTLRPFDDTPKTQLNPEVQPFTPRQTEVTQQSQMIMIDTFTKHLVKKDLIMSRLSIFDDDPIMYVSWKKGFINIMEELGASETERLELLCEKLGPESSRQARTIRACNADSPSIAIKKIWERLERRFGAAEQIENYILKKIKEFPEISSDHFHLLYDLADLASEIASLKAQPQFEV